MNAIDRLEETGGLQYQIGRIVEGTRFFGKAFIGPPDSPLLFGELLAVRLPPDLIVIDLDDGSYWDRLHGVVRSTLTIETPNGRHLYYKQSETPVPHVISLFDAPRLWGDYTDADVGRRPPKRNVDILTFPGGRAIIPPTPGYRLYVDAPIAQLSSGLAELIHGLAPEPTTEPEVEAIV